MRIQTRNGQVRVSRASLVGDAFTIGMQLASLGRGLLSAQQRGKQKRQAGGLVAKGLKTQALVPMGPLAQDTQRVMNTVGARIIDPIMNAVAGRPIVPANSGLPVMRNGTPTFPVTVSRGRRRMNPLNPRALRRAISRVTSFSKFARRTVSIVTRTKLKKRRRR